MVVLVRRGGERKVPPVARDHGEIQIAALLRHPRIGGRQNRRHLPRAQVDAVDRSAGAATVRYRDGTRVEIEGGASVDFLPAADDAGKTVWIERSILTADVAPQPPGKPMLFDSRGATTRVLGTLLSVRVTGDETRVQVREGRVQLTRKSDGKALTVGTGELAVAAPKAFMTAPIAWPSNRQGLVFLFETNDKPNLVRSSATGVNRSYSVRPRGDAQLNRDSKGPDLPPASHLAHGGEADPNGEGIDITLEELTTEWRLMADLYALAIQTDRVRFGAITFLAAGERIRLKGKYEYGGRTVFEFDDAGQRRKSGSNACSHEWWHDFDENKKNQQLRAHAHLKMREVAYFLQRLAGTECVEPNGKTILENSLVTISTESGDGRHNDVKRELSGIFHAITSANGRFTTGQILDLGAAGIDVYNTMLEAFGASRRLGPADHKMQRVDSIRA